MFNSTWYKSLIKPPLSPPDTVFGPMWSFLYFCIFLSLVLFFIKNESNKKFGYALFFTQLFLNFLWVVAFFSFKSIVLGFCTIVFLDITVFFTIIEFYKNSKLSAILLFPYFIWILFATYLNFEFLVLN